MLILKKKINYYVYISIFLLCLIFILTHNINNFIKLEKNVHQSFSEKDYDLLLTKYNNLLISYQEKLDEGYILNEKIDTLNEKIKLDFEETKNESKLLDLQPKNVTGVIVLGMHRSGTSMLGGLMTKLGLKTGGPLIPPNYDNKKGFFERIDVVNMNDKLLRVQNMDYSFRLSYFNHLVAVHDVIKVEKENNFLDKLKLLGVDQRITTQDLLENSKNIFFQEGRFALHFLNNPANTPWILKDPRLCVTLKFWLSFLNSQPAIVFSYRHPFDVASSLISREKIKIDHGLKLWYIYNKFAIINSKDLCRVVVSNKDLLTDTMNTMEKIKIGLRSCGMVLPSEADKFNEKIATEIIDLSLQHSNGSTQDLVCKNVINKIDAFNYEKNINLKYFYSIENLDDIELPPKWPIEDALQHKALYKEAMRLYCALENGEAFNTDFPFNTEIHEGNTEY